MSAEKFRNFATSYGVGRGLLKDCEGDYLKFLKAELKNWPDSLSEKAMFAHEFAKKCSDAESPLTRGRCISLASKAIWFIKPKNWTLFDKYAERALQDAPKKRSEARITRFYREIERLGFEDVCSELREKIGTSHFPFLWSERLIDKCLVVSGGLRWKEYETEAFVETLCDRKCAFEDLAYSCSKVLANSEFGSVLKNR